MLWRRLLRLIRRCGAAVLRWMFRAPTALYRHDLGWVLGHRFCALTHVGRRSGRRYLTVLEVLDYLPETHEVFVVSGFGRRADWLRNIEAAPAVHLQVGRDGFAPDHRLLAAEEAVAVLAGYEQRHRLIMPVVRPILSRLSGVRYDGSAVARGELVQRLPVVCFRPRSG